MKKIICVVFSALFLSTVASGVQFGDIREDYTLYFAGDPFAITVATNAYRIASGEPVLRTIAIQNATNALTAKFAQDISDEASARIAGDSVSVGLTLNTSNALYASSVSLVNAETSARVVADSGLSNFVANTSNRLSIARATADSGLSNLVSSSAHSSTQYTDAAVAPLATTSALNTAVASLVPTNRTITIGTQVGSLQSNLVFASSGGGVTETTATNIAQEVISPFTNKIETAWQNPFYATNYTWTSDGNNITLTSYDSTSGGNEVIIPRLLSGLVVENLGSTFNNNDSITSISGGENIKQIGASAFYNCFGLSSIDLPNLVSIGIYAFGNCSIESINLPNVKSVGIYAFGDCYNLRSVYFGQNAPTDSPTIYDNAENVTNYVTNPTATGWGGTFGGRPVVRMPIYADMAIIAGTNIQDTIGQRVEKSDGTATNLSVSGTLNLNGEQVISAAGVTNVAISLQQLFDTNHYTKAEIDATSSAPYKAWTGTITPANGTATVTYAHGNMPRLTITSPTVITLDPTGYGTSGVSRVSLSLYSGTNAVTFNTNLITFATAPTISTNCWNSILIRRAANCIWKGVGL